MTDSPLTWTPRQLERLAWLDCPRAVDVHCHCLPGLDDGPSNLAGALSLCAALVEDGFTTVIATPHQLGRYDSPGRADRIRAAVENLVEVLEAEGLPLEILPGADVRIDERIGRLITSGEVVTVADGRRHFLLELPHSQFLDPKSLIKQLTAQGLQTILTHPERHEYLQGDLSRPRSWIEAGARLQITAGSVLGAFGSAASDYAWKLLDAGLVSLVATDAHDASRRPPRQTEAIALLCQSLPREQVRQLVGAAPCAVLQGELLPSPLTL